MRAAPASQAARDRRRTAAAVTGLPATQRQSTSAGPACGVPPHARYRQRGEISHHRTLGLRVGLGDAVIPVLCSMLGVSV